MQRRVPQVEGEPKKPGVLGLRVQPGNSVIDLIGGRVPDLADHLTIDDFVPGELGFRATAHQPGEMIEARQIRVICPTVTVTRQMPFTYGRCRVSEIRVGLQCHR